MSDDVLTTISDVGVATVTLNRPDVRNAWSIETVEELTDVLEQLAAHPTVRVLVLTGSGSAFSAGGDLNWMKQVLEAPDTVGRTGAIKIHGLLDTIDSFPHPVIARVNGPAFGGGFGMVCAADIAVASSNATLGLSEVRIGIVPAMISPFVLRKLGSGGARAFCLSGAPIPAAEAGRIGLVQRVVDEEELDAAVSAIVDEILKSSPGAVAAAKSLFRSIKANPEEDHLEIALEAIDIAWKSDAAAEGIAAFLEKRPPEWNAKSD